MTQNVHKFQTPIRVGVLASDPVSATNGMIFYSSSTNTFRMYQNGAFTDVGATTGFTANRAIVSNGSGALTVSATTDVEIGYVSGVTSAIQTQINGKLSLTGGTMSGNIAMGGSRVTGLGAPAAAADAATKQYVDDLVEGRKWKEPVSVVAIANLNLSSMPASVDGVTLAQDDRFLAAGQTTGSQNGIYVFNGAGNAATRAADMSSSSEVLNASMFISEGTYADTQWVCTTNAPIALNTTALVFVQSSGAGGITAGNGISISGNTVSVRHDGEGLAFSGADLSLELDGSTLSKSATGLKVADGGIGSTQIANDSILNIDINSAAAIAYSKLAALTADRALISNGSGFVSVSSVTATELGYVSGVTSAIQTQLNGKASTALDNLSTTSINADLLPSADGVRSIGSTSLGWLKVWTSSIEAEGTALSLVAQSGFTFDANDDGTVEVSITSAKMRVAPIASRGASDSTDVEEEYKHSVALNASVVSPTAVAALGFAHADFEGVEISYKMKEATSNRVRIGTIRIGTNGTDTTITDEFAETADLGVAWTVAISGANVEVRYTNSAGNAVTMRADVKRFRA